VKLDARRAEAFLAKPAAYRGALLHGEDTGRIREAARALTLRLAGALDDPFRVTELDREHWPRLPDEAATLPLGGGTRVVRIREATDALARPLEDALATPAGSFLLLEAPGLGKGTLRRLAEAAPDFAAIAFYPAEGAARTRLIETHLAADRLRLTRPALDWLDQTLPSDHAALTAELDKLVLYAEPGATLDEAECLLCCGDLAESSAESAVTAALRGDPAATARDIERAYASGQTGIGLLRTLLGQLLRLDLVRRAVGDGLAQAEALRLLRPPLFYRTQPAFELMLRRWSERGLTRALARTRETEFASKQTGADAELLAASLLLAIARSRG
jgi:DNA polymerase III subunit delta